MSSWILLFVIFWGGGWLVSKTAFSDDWVRVPLPLFALLGWPRHKSVRPGIASARGVGLQTAGLVLVWYRLVNGWLYPDKLEHYNLGAALLIAYCFAAVAVVLLRRFRSPARPAIEEDTTQRRVSSESGTPAKSQIGPESSTQWQHSYRYNSRYRATMLGTAALSIVMVPVLYARIEVETTADMVGLSGLAGFFVIIAVVLIAEWQVGRLTTSPSGIQWVSLFGRLFVEWSRFRGFKSNGFTIFLAFEPPASSPASPPARWRRRTRLRYGQLSPYVEDLANSPLIDDIRRNIPGAARE